MSTSQAEEAIKRSTPAPPSAFGRYQVQKVLGSGGCGTVYLGHDEQLDRSVAIKVLREGASASQAQTTRFLQEARRLAQLSHPGIVAIHDVGAEEGWLYLVSEFLAGPDLGRWMSSNRPDRRESVRIVAAVADALGHAHARSIVHRDIKPGNIIVTPDRGPVVVDFGIGLDEEVSGGAQLGAVVGTPAYMAPEQVQGSAHRIDGRCDIYSLGVVLYELLCGRPPFRASTVAEIMRQVRDDEPQPPRQLQGDIPAAIEQVCLKALSKRIQDRHTTALDFADELRRADQAHPGRRPAAAERDVAKPPAPQPSRPDSLAAAPSGAQSDTFRRRAREAEHRQVTILICGSSLFASESYLETLDTEDQAALLRDFRERSEPAILRYGGSVVQFNEDGLLACFGYPAALEDAVDRAALAALGVMENLKPLCDRLGRAKLALDPWIGIHTGPAIVEAGEASISLVGEARNIAVRLAEIAAPNAIIATAAAHRLIKMHIASTHLGTKKIKGVSEPISVFRIEGVAPAGRESVQWAQAALSPLTGRDHEVRLLESRWEQTCEGMGQVVLLTGEPGLGKSRLVDTLKRHALGTARETDPFAPVVEWRCSPHHRDTALRPAIDHFEHALAFATEDSPQQRFDRLLEHLERLNLAKPESVALFASLLSLEAPARFAPPALSPARLREESLRLLVDWLHARAERSPMLFIVEDLHWIDASTLEFLERLVAEGLHAPILAVFTSRPEFQMYWPAVAHPTSLALNRLSRREAGELIRAKAGGAVSAKLIDRIYERTGGVPLFVEEFTRMVQESGGLEPSAQGDEPAGTLPAREIPDTLQDLVAARLDRMDGEREVARICAVLGREFRHEWLAAVAELDDASLQAELAKLALAEIVFAKGRPPHCTYFFKHALLEDALYNSLVKDKRRGLHRRIADVLERRFPQTVETQPELLAHHCAEAGLTERAAGYLLKAGVRSRQRGAEREALGQLSGGLALLDNSGPTEAADALRLDLLSALGPAAISVKGYAAPEVGPILLRADELCRHSGDETRRFGILLGRWEWNLVRGELEACVGLAAETMSLAHSRDDPGMLMEALFARGVTMFYRAEFASARTCFEQALASYHDRDRTRFWSAYTGHNAGVTHRCYLALTLWHLGFPDQAERLDAEARELARTIGHAFTIGHAADFTAFLHLYRRAGAELSAAAEEEFAGGAEQGFQLWQALGILHKGAGRLFLGRPEDALPLLEQGYQAFRTTGAELRAPAYLSLLGEASTRLGRFEAARQALDEALAIAAKNDDRSHEPELHRLKGELCLAEANDHAAALASFQAAVACAQRQQSRAWELRGALSLSRLLAGQGRRDEARAALVAITDAFTEGLSTPDLVAARELIGNLA